MSEKLEKYLIEEERLERIEQSDAILALASIIRTPAGVKLFSYLFKNFDVAELPDESLEGKMLYERIGVLRAGNSIYKLACEADVHVAASILSKIERERYDKLYREHQLQNDNGYDD